MKSSDIKKDAYCLSKQVMIYLGQPTQMRLEDARKKLFHGKGKIWIKYWILGKHPEILTTNNPDNGWIDPGRGTGTAIVITDVLRANDWLATHHIDWSAPDPRTLANRVK
ncbi:hypothetical protein [Limosilactobacillus antri]|uniref:hypothetical protein n=1 Tax=Limosilactobacillus antri TaxID=227943 RepID=UPI001F5A8FFB|nr:hypothetical protein [Limosilactobacillus antri]